MKTVQAFVIVIWLTAACSVAVSSETVGNDMPAMQTSSETTVAKSDITVIKLSKELKHPYVCLPSEVCGVKNATKRGDEKARGFVESRFQDQSMKTDSTQRHTMVVRGFGAYCTLDGKCYDAPGKSDGKDHRPKQEKRRIQKSAFGIPATVLSDKGRGFGGISPSENAVVGVRGYASAAIAEDRREGGGKGTMMLVDFSSSAYLFALNLLDDPASIYINDQYYGNLGAGIKTTFLIPEGPITVSITDIGGNEATDTVNVPAGELVYYVIRPYDDVSGNRGNGAGPEARPEQH